MAGKTPSPLVHVINMPLLSTPRRPATARKLSIRPVRCCVVAGLQLTGCETGGVGGRRARNETSEGVALGPPRLPNPPSTPPIGLRTNILPSPPSAQLDVKAL